MMKKTIHLLIIIFIFNISVAFFAFSCAFSEQDVKSSKQELSEPFTLDTPEETTMPVFDIKKSLIRMVISLILVLAFIFSIAFIFKKISSSPMPFNKGKGLLRVIEKYPLGPKNYLMLVWAIDRMVLVSFNNGSIEKISEFKSETITREIENDFFSESLQREETVKPLEEVSNA